MTIQRTLTVSLLSLFFFGTAFAAGPMAEVATDASGIYFAPARSGDYTLTIDGPNGFSLRRTFEGAAPSFQLGDVAEGLADGTYTYELVAIPARSADDRAAAVAIARNVQSGAFTIAGGSLVDPSRPETGGEKAQVFVDDLIVEGSACIGVDCSPSEAFGFDTIRLKENNLRIKFVDTSGSASFPGNDWELTANDSTNGGVNRFSIRDVDGGKDIFTVRAGAPNHSLYVDDEGHVGVGTSTPAVNLHVVEGDTPTLRLEQDGSEGFQSHTWDVAGNETNFFIRDVTNNKLPFRIKPGAPKNSIFVAADGDVGLGTETPSQPLHVHRTDASARILVEEASTTESLRTLLELSNNGGVRITMRDTSGDGGVWRLDNNSADDFFIRDNADSTNELKLDADGNLTISGTLTTGSGGMCSGGCDRVFAPEYDLESIEAHTAFMWENSYLPGVGPTPEDAVSVNLTEKTGGILNELEKAHIYISQLHQRLARLEALLDEEGAE